MKLQFRLMENPLEFTFTISRSSKSIARTVLIEVCYDDHGEALIGTGEAVPSSFYGEDAESVMAFYTELDAKNFLRTHDPFNLQELEVRLAQHPGNMAAKAGLEMAVQDLRGKLLNVPLYKLWGLDPHLAPKTSYTIGIADLDTVKRKTETALARGYEVLKVKLGSQQDLDLLETIRETAPEATIRIDANAAWTAQETLTLIPALQDYGVEFMEEPLRLDSPESDYERLKAESSMILMADESCRTLRDIPRCARFFHAINLKHSKTGGLGEALRMIHAAKAHDLKIMLGCFAETSVSITAFAHLSPLVDYADLDGSLLLAQDPFDGVQFEGSQIKLPTRPGIGAVPRKLH